MAKLPTKWTPAETDRFFRERLAEYQGDSLLVDDLVDTDEYTLETARREIGNLETLKLYLEDGALPDILADRTACKALKDALLARRNDVIKVLVMAARTWKKKSKRGPKGKMVGGRYIYQRVWTLRQDERLTWPMVAQRAFGDKAKIALAKAHYRLAKMRHAQAGPDDGTPATRVG